MRTFSQTLLSLSTVANIRGLKSIAAALCFGITLCLTGIANAQTDTYSWTGTIVSVEVDDGTGIYTGTQVGDTFSGTFTYDPDPGNISELFTSDGDSIIEPGDTWAEYILGSGGGTITDGTTQLITNNVEFSSTNDHPIDEPGQEDIISTLFGKEVAFGTLTDEWDVSNGFGNVRVAARYLSLLTTMLDDVTFRSTPPWSPPASPDDPANQIAFFEISEEPPTGEIFSAYGIITMAQIGDVPPDRIVPIAITIILGEDSSNCAEGDYVLIERVAPVYPARALSRGIEGYVDMSFTVTATGTVKDPIVIFSTSSLFDRAATNAVLKFEYRPRCVDGQPVEVVGVQTRIMFEIEE